MIKLSVNLNKVATLRNTRNLNLPSVIKAAETCIAAGAHGITVHPRPDQRHIKPADVFELADLLKNHPDVEFNIEGNPFEKYRELVAEVRPAQCTLVPDTPDQQTSDHGWNVPRNSDQLRPVLEELKALRCRVSLFMDHVPEMMAAVAEVGADRIELYTEPFADAFAKGREDEVLPRYVEAAERARDLGLGVNAGHDLNQENLPVLVKAIPFLSEVSIGHALIAEALDDGLPVTVQRYLAILEQA